jgi:UDP-3-O-[3-hydroxymyristoyl] glucosamine N-acyltransferase
MTTAPLRKNQRHICPGISPVPAEGRAPPGGVGWAAAAATAALVDSGFSIGGFGVAVDLGVLVGAGVFVGFGVRVGAGVFVARGVPVGVLVAVDAEVGVG